MKIYLADLHHKINYDSGLGIVYPLNIGYVAAFLQNQINNLDIKLFKYIALNQHIKT